MKHGLFSVICAVALLTAHVAPAAAQGLPGAAERPDSGAGLQTDRAAERERCKADPQKCRAEMKARRQEWCKANPQRCEEMKARFEKRREECKSDPAKCRDGKDRNSGGK